MPLHDTIKIFGAHEHNLKHIDLEIPRNKLVVFTGLSGSGKSSLAFDTIFAEGQRRYMETFASYARQFIGEMKKPDVEKIEGLSPVIAIEQKTVNKNPRSTVGTTTEIYDFLRLLYARASTAYSWKTGREMVIYTDEQIISTITENHEGKQVVILAPKVKARKGHYRELFDTCIRKGFAKVRVDGVMADLVPNMQVSRYGIHDVELVIDRLTVDSENLARLKSSIQLALKEGGNNLMIINENDRKLHYYSKNLMDPESGISYDEPQPNTFSFNSPYGWCPECKGFGEIFHLDRDSIILYEDKSIKDGGLLILEDKNNYHTSAVLSAISRKYNFGFDTPISKLPKEAVEEILYGSREKLIIPTAYMDYEFAFNGLIDRYKNLLENKEHLVNSEEAENMVPLSLCPSCHGKRLKPESLCFKIDGKDISDLGQMQIDELYQWICTVENKMAGNKRLIAAELLKETQTRIEFLLQVGLEYLSLNRTIYSLSGGEAQRIRLATQLGTQLINVLYIIDEPSIGLHQRDNIRLINALKNLSSMGNSVVVVEHDKEMMLNADYLVDLGPKAGIHGGQVMFAGKVDEIAGFKSITADYLTGKKQIEVPSMRRTGNGNFLVLESANGNNLKDICLNIPLGKLICITGVSGSGKSSLINDTLYPILQNHFFRTKHKPLPYKKFSGFEHIDKVIEIDQAPIGRTPRSNPATYTGMFTNIRNLFSELQEAKIRGYKPGRFSFNVKGGRCEECQGAGMKSIQMDFLPDVYIECPACMGRRYNRETLEVRYKGHSINDVLNMTINQAYDFFENIPMIKRKLKTLKDVGMGYVHLGQASTTLSGGEAQRIKLATELSKRSTGKTLYILDEPTTGLHFEDIRVLMEVLNKFVDQGNTVLIIEHNMDVVKLADHIIDMGPEGGEEGGRIICEGTPEEIVKSKCGYTAKFLAKELAR